MKYSLKIFSSLPPPPVSDKVQVLAVHPGQTGVSDIEGPPAFLISGVFAPPTLANEQIVLSQVIIIDQ